MSQKLATIIIATQNRKQVLFDSLHRLAAIDNGSFQIMVYDDGSAEDYSDEFKRVFPKIIFFRDEKAQGCLVLRNRLIQRAVSPYIISLDDDSYFTNIKDYDEAIKIMESDPNLALCCFKVLIKEGIQFPEDTSRTRYETNMFIGCGFIARRADLLEVGGFDEFFFRQGEERDIALRLIAAGKHLLQANDITVFHEYTSVNRDHQLIHGYAFRNELYFFIKYFPFPLCLFKIIKCFVSHTLFCLRKGWFRAYFFAFRQAFMNLPAWLRSRKPLSPLTIKRYYSV